MNKWYLGAGSDSDIAISTRIRLARNLDGFVFPRRIDDKSAQDVENIVKEALAGEKLVCARIDEQSSAELQAMVERHLISPPFVSGGLGRSVIYSEDESLSIMVNEEDHIRIQVMLPGSDIKAALQKADAIDDIIEKKATYAFDDKLGYLTQCPTNLGTGLRASVMLHLPALTANGYMHKLSNMVSKLGLTIRGTYGESTDAVGSLYQISNQVTMGISEETSVANLQAIVNQVIREERNARKLMFENRIEFEDRFCRSKAILKSAKLISTKEVFDILSVLRVGVSLGLLEEEKCPILSSLLFEVSAGGINALAGRELTETQRDMKRAEIVNSLEI